MTLAEIKRWFDTLTEEELKQPVASFCVLINNQTEENFAVEDLEFTRSKENLYMFDQEASLLKGEKDMVAKGLLEPSQSPDFKINDPIIFVKLTDVI